MTKYPLRGFPQFYLTAESPCPYLPGRQERKIFTPLDANDAAHLHDHLTLQGFRRSQNIVYKPACKGCNACVSVRVAADQFSPGKTFRRLQNRNADLTSRDMPPIATHDQFRLMRTYLDNRHQDGGMADMTGLDYSAMVEETEVETRVIEYRLPEAPTEPGGTATPGELVAVALTDVLGDGLSMVYSFFDPTLTTRSLGTYMILDHISRARGMGLPFVYLGYWVDGCRKMDYKRRFEPLEHLIGGHWVPSELV
ncbi:MAG: arginyltransferase [Pseudomonadota bacterium]